MIWPFRRKRRWVIRCPHCGHVSPWEPPQKIIVSRGPAPSETITPDRIPMLCVACSKGAWDRVLGTRRVIWRWHRLSYFFVRALHVT